MIEGVESKSIFLKKGGELIGLHAAGYDTDQGFQQIEAWCNSYTLGFKFLGSVFRIFGPIEDEAEAFKKQGWVEIPEPTPEDSTPGPEAA